MYKVKWVGESGLKVLWFTATAIFCDSYKTQLSHVATLSSQVIFTAMAQMAQVVTVAFKTKFSPKVWHEKRKFI